jgi:hypothetical protein
MQKNHSCINGFPIDYSKFPLAKKYKYAEVILHPNEYLVIPRLWSHWVFSEPYTLAISYNIGKDEDKLMKFDGDIVRYNTSKINNNDNIIFSNLGKSLPHTGAYGYNGLISYKDFINSSINLDFNFICSETEDICPVIKPDANYNKCSFMGKLDNILSDSFFINKYLYVGQHNLTTTIPPPTQTQPPTQTMPSAPINPITNLLNIPNFDNIVNDGTFAYTSKVWFNFDKPVDSGLHHDGVDNILYVLTGRKKVLLAHPVYNQYIYITDLPHVKSIYS